MAAQRGEFARAATAGAGAGEAGVAGSGWPERAAKDGVSAALCRRDGDCRNRPGGGLERGYGEGAPFARSGESARRGKGEIMSLKDGWNEPGERDSRVEPGAGLGMDDGARQDRDLEMERALRDFRLSVHAWS